MVKNKIPIVLATDKNYLPQTCVTIISALENPVMIHYADKNKPWNAEVWLDKYWHKYAAITPYSFTMKKIN